MTLSFMQDWTVTYKAGENIGLFPAEADDRTRFGVFLLSDADAGYEQDTIFSDGPIIYGTGMSDEDRAKHGSISSFKWSRRLIANRGTTSSG